jgi:hypothetical protein
MKGEDQNEIEIIKKKMATIRLMLQGLSIKRAQQAAKLKTGELSSETTVKDQEILLTEMLYYDTCVNVLEGLEKSLI